MRPAVVGLLFVVVAALEIGHGLFRLEESRRRQRGRLEGDFASRREETARRVRDAWREAADHCVALARASWVTDAAAPDATSETRARTARDLSGYLSSFRFFDRIRVLDSTGHERVRVERMGQGVAVMPDSRLDPEPDRAMMAIAAGIGAAGSSLPMHEANRIEVAAKDRLVFHHAADFESDGHGGRIVVTTYAEPLAAEIRSLCAATGGRGSMVDAEGRDVLAEGPADAVINVQGASMPVLGESSRRVGDGGVLFLDRLFDSPPLWLALDVPESEFTRLGGFDGGEARRIIWTTATATLILAALGFVFVRSQRRAAELLARRALERQMEARERLSSLGLLTAGVAHEINNPLEGIGNYLTLIERGLEEGDKRKKWLEQVRHGFERIRAIVRDLLEFGRKGDDLAAVDLGQVIDRVERLLGYSTHGKDVTLRRHGFESTVLVHGNSGRLEQVFVNLVLNAAKAMSGRGTIDIRASRASRSGDEMIEIRVEDDGPGIPAEHMGRIFDPFFTLSDGTGLGLSIVYGIVQAHNGTIEVGNLEPHGASFRLFLLPGQRSSEVVA